MKLTTGVIVLVIVIASIGAYMYIPSFQEDIDDVVDDVIPPANDTQDDDYGIADYPIGWNVPGNVNHIELTMQVNGQIKMFYYHQVMKSDQTQYWGGGIDGLKINLNQWGISDTQIACGLAQLDAM